MNYLDAENNKSICEEVNEDPVNVHTQDVHTEIQQPAISEATSESNNAIVMLQTNSNIGNNSGDLLQQAVLLNSAAENSAKNQFVQVSRHGSIGLIAGSGSETTQHGLVSSSVITYTSTTPTLTTHVSHITHDNEAIPEFAVDRVSTPGNHSQFGFKADANVHLKEISPLNPIHQVDTGMTVTPLNYVLCMTVEDVSPKKEKETTKTQHAANNSLDLNLLEPQHTSTPKPKMKEQDPLNETIIAGHLGSTQSSHDAKFPEKDLQLNKGILKTFDEKNDKLVGRKEVSYQGHFSASDEVSHEDFTTKEVAPKLKTDHNLHLLQINPLETKISDGKSHNVTYCMEWVSKDLLNPNTSLAQSDKSSTKNEGTSVDLDLSSLNITSISHNKAPECTEGEKFISQRHKNRDLMKLSPTTKTQTDSV